ncbi:MAG: D-alanyl-D-alanine carboxypeptidase family protein, partial [Oscillospiraceae bacterium]|nr:D-alanyl-D-alanine carboxypeptidase family protein [Oscillospiraceae bacterium]
FLCYNKDMSGVFYEKFQKEDDKLSQKNQKVDRTYAVFTLLMLSVVLVFAFGLMIGKQNLKHAETVQKTMQIEKETENPDNSDSEQNPAENPVPEIIPEKPELHSELKTAVNFWSMDSHIYLRVNHEKQIDLGTRKDILDLSDAVYTIDDTTIATVSDSGMLTGLTKGKCTVSVTLGDEMLQIPVTIRELTVQNGCTYVDGILVANKSYGMPADYDPGMLPETADAFARLQEDAQALGLNIYMGSGYRNYEHQVRDFDSMCRAYGEEYASMVSARAGYSEHQTGYTIDCNTINNDFAETPEGQWLAANCHLYGFIVRYPLGKEAITGYDYESWHIRYVGVEAATEIYEHGLTLEEYLDVESVYLPAIPEQEYSETPETPEPVQNSELTSNSDADASPAPDPAEFIDAPMDAPI